MVWLWPICLPAICEKNRYTRWTLQRANVPVQHSLQQYRLIQPEEWIPKTTEPEQACCQRSGETNTRMCFWQRKLTAYRQTQNSCLRTMALVGRHSSRSNDLSVHARIDSTGYVRLLWESREEDDTNSHAAMFEVRFVKKKEKGVK